MQPRVAPQSALIGAKDLTPTLDVFWSFTIDQLQCGTRDCECEYTLVIATHFLISFIPTGIQFTY